MTKLLGPGADGGCAQTCAAATGRPCPPGHLSAPTRWPPVGARLGHPGLGAPGPCYAAAPTSGSSSPAPTPPGPPVLPLLRELQLLHPSASSMKMAPCPVVTSSAFPPPPSREPRPWAPQVSGALARVRRLPRAPEQAGRSRGGSGAPACRCFAGPTGEVGRLARGGSRATIPSAVISCGSLWPGGGQGAWATVWVPPEGQRGARWRGTVSPSWRAPSLAPHFRV